MSQEKEVLQVQDNAIQPSEAIQKLTLQLSQKQLENNELQGEILKLQKENQSMSLRTLKVHEENQMYKASPELAAKMAEMEFHFKMAERFIKSGAFKVKTVEEAYVLIKAGAEMGLKPMEAMQSLYIVNGAVKSHGAGMVAIITKRGYKIEFLNENPQSVTVRIYHPDESIDFDETEVVEANGQILARSKAMGFAKKNKMRFHGIRMFASFHLAHLFGSVEDEFTSDFHEWDKEQPNGIEIGKTEKQKEQQRVIDFINKAKTPEQLAKVDEAVKRYGLETTYMAKLAELQNQHQLQPA